MKHILFSTCLLRALFFVCPLQAQTNPDAGSNPVITIVTDYFWDVSGRQTQFGEYPLSAEQVASATSPLYGGTFKAVAAVCPPGAQVIPGTVPIWRFAKAQDSWEAYQFRKTIPLGPETIRKATLQVNCDDAARVYINKRQVDEDHSGETLNDSRGGQSFFRNLTTAIYSNVRTYDVTGFFYANVTNTILVEVANQPYNDNHAYLSAKLVIELVPPPPTNPKPETPQAKPDQVATKPVTSRPDKPRPVPAPETHDAVTEPDKIVFEAGSDPELEKLRVGSILELGHVYFKVNDYKLDSISYRTLSSLASYMKRHPSLKIEVGGHTNLLAYDDFAARLSTDRARTVRQYLLDNGVAPDRVTSKGYGKSRPKINAVTKEANKANQRVEMKVLEK